MVRVQVPPWSPFFGGNQYAQSEVSHDESLRKGGENLSWVTPTRGGTGQDVVVLVRPVASTA